MDLNHKVTRIHVKGLAKAPVKDLTSEPRTFCSSARPPVVPCRSRPLRTGSVLKELTA